MARNLLLVSLEICLPKSVKEMSMHGDEPPPQFIIQKNNFNSKDSTTLIPIPIVDLNLLSTEDELEKLRSALSSGGCVQAIGHGMRSCFLDQVREVAKQFFALPEEEKQKYGQAVNESEGYGNDLIDQIVSEKQVLTLTVLPRDKRRLSLWPQNPTHFSEILEEFSVKMKSMMDCLLKSMEKSLNLEERSFLSQFGERSLMQARFNFYPSCSRPDLVLGVKPHRDRSGVTVLLQDRDVESVQVLIDNKWVNVPTIPGALVVNLGDLMQIMSNRISKTPTHRVMTNFSLKAEVEVLADCVQELNLDSENFPEKYIVKEGRGDGIYDALLPSQEIPVVDLSLLISPSKAAEEIEKLKSALISWGCFQAINHGMTNTYLDKLHEVYKQFFQLPMEEKIKYLREPNDTEGYGNDVIFTENQRFDWHDRVYLKVLPVDQRKFKIWPQNPKDFGSITLEYTERIKLLAELILKAMAKALNLEEDSFWKQYGERGAMFLRLNYYPPCPRPDLALGVRPHADGSTITFLLQDKNVEGLQVLKDNKWFKVPIIPEALVVIVGDQMEIMSNGIFKSSVHRVVINSEKERLSVAMFCNPDEEKEVEPVDKLVNEWRPRLYKSVKNYEQTYFLYYRQGKRPVDAIKI